MDEPESVDIDWIARYRAEPGDTIVLRLASRPSPAAHEYLLGALKRVWPDNEVIVLDLDATLEVVQKG